MNKAENAFGPELVIAYQEEHPFLRLNDIVYNCLENAILTLKLQPGSKINASEIAKALNVSITPVNNAVQRLITEGLICRYPRSAGYYVFDVDDILVSNIYDFRRCLEGYASYECARVSPTVDLTKLHDLASAFKDGWTVDPSTNEKVKYENEAQRQFADYEFHKLIIDSSNNTLLTEAYAKLQPKITYTLLRSLKYWDEHSDAIFRKQLAGQHMNITNTISLGIPEMARQVAEYHVSFSQERFRIYRDL